MSACSAWAVALAATSSVAFILALNVLIKDPQVLRVLPTVSFRLTAIEGLLTAYWRAPVC